MDVFSTNNSYALAPLDSSKKAGESQKSDDSDETKLPQLPGLSSHIASKHAVCNYGSSYGRSILHKAVCEMDLTTIQSELATENVKEALARRDDAGYCPLHSASALQMLNLNNPVLAVEIVRQLVAAGADPYAEDDEGNTPLHWAARAGDQAAAEFLIAKNSTLGKRWPSKRKQTFFAFNPPPSITEIYIFLLSAQMPKIIMERLLCIGQCEQVVLDWELWLFY